MRLKHILYIVTIVCALAEIGMALYAMYWAEILKDIAYAEHVRPHNELIIVKALNIALPAGVLCMALLVYTRKIDGVGAFGLFMAAALHLMGLDLNVRAVKKIYGHGTPLADITWWVPAEKQAVDGAWDGNAG